MHQIWELFSPTSHTYSTIQYYDLCIDEFHAYLATACRLHAERPSCLPLTAVTTRPHAISQLLSNFLPLKLSERSNSAMVHVHIQPCTVRLSQDQTVKGEPGACTRSCCLTRLHPPIHVSYKCFRDRKWFTLMTLVLVCHSRCSLTCAQTHFYIY